MDVGLEECILAIVALSASKAKVTAAVPTFWAEDMEEAQHLCLLLSRVLKGMTHDLENGLYLIVRH